MLVNKRPCSNDIEIGVLEEKKVHFVHTVIESSFSPIKAK